MIADSTTIYDSYASVYEAIGQWHFSVHMAEWTIRWLQERGFAARRTLDLACGTGAAALVFAAAGHTVVGVDRSPAMLNIAYAKARDTGTPVSFLQADIRDLSGAQRSGARTGSRLTSPAPYEQLADRPNSQPPAPGLPPGSFDLVTCFADSLNYLTGDDDLLAVFQCI